MRNKNLLLISIVLFLAFAAQAEIIFEGYYKVTQFKKHIGFLILRHEIDNKTNYFKTISFIKLGKAGFDLTESYKVVSDSELAPISISYLAAGEKKTKTIEAEFKNQKMSGTIVENGKKIKLNEKAPKGVFLSSALYYIMLKSKNGLETNTKFDYSAITEEGPVVMTGKVSVDRKMVTQGSLQLLNVSNSFAGSDYTNLITPQGEVISASTPATSIESELVKNKEEALEGIKLSPGTLEKIFGNLPAGTTNVYHSKSK